MKAIKYSIIVLCLFAAASPIYSQEWKWGSEGYGSLKTNDYGSPVATDNDGNAYITGQYDNIIVFGSTILTGNSENAYLVKYNSAGNVVWARQPDNQGNSYSFSASVATDAKGDVFITGTFEGSVEFGNITLTNTNYYSTFLVKYDSAGNVLWAKQSTIDSFSYYYSQVNCYSVCTDKSGNAFITGTFRDTILFGTHTLSSPNFFNTFLVKYDASGNVLWAKQSNQQSLYSNTNPVSMSVAADNDGNSFIAGSFSDTVLFGTDTIISSYIGGYSNVSAFLVKYSPAGNVLWAEESGNGSYASSCNGNSVTTDQSGSAYITGTFSNIVSFGSYTVYSPATDAAFLTKYDAGGNAQWAKQSSPGWSGTTLASDAANDIYLTGGIYQQNTDTLAFGNFKLSTNPRSYSASYIVEFDSKGEADCGSILNYFGGYTYGNQSTGIASSASGMYIYMAGILRDDTTLCGPDTLLPQGGGANVFVARWEPCNIPNITPPPNTQGGGSEPCDNIFIPNVFSPNGDGHDDVLYVRSPCIRSMDFSVFDRWGNRIFETQNINIGWDGSYRGTPAAIGTYIWYLTGTTIDGATVERNGNVTLVR